MAGMLAGLRHETRDALHLAVSVRSFRAEKVSEFVGALIAGEDKSARALYQEIKATYPIAVTRDLERAWSWLRSRARGSERFGLVASSGAYRLKPEGLNVSQDLSATHWFLNDKSDVRSSYYLEDPATEFDIQGLELDWVGVCWEADFRIVDGKWSHHKFSGSAWQNVNNEHRRTYLANAYRVLLTRARQGMIVYVPRGNPNDPTRQPIQYEATFQFLLDCGLEAT
ncbi:DUF2075 domain-containing protein [Bradyrhizobium sp. WSM 1791]|uniref:DUF2075 domain-containing protein n=2 Tax=Bradyrhizobium australiense TaxID=2721161 RepID=A0A7Y4LUG4_9BRAD|nr:DUF2075 domain-containing protein [Bradyrhizobium australiense]